MNKYQVALDNIWLDINESVIYSTDLERLMKDLKTLGELVDLAIPKKVNNKENHYVFETYELSHVSGDCPNCGKVIYYDEYEISNYCPNCGQAIDWAKRKTAREMFEELGWFENDN